MSTTHQTYLAETAADEAVPAPYQRLHRIPTLDHTASAALIGDASETKPARIDYAGQEPVSFGAWGMVLFGLLCGVAGYVLAVML
jgi:hypothetical protein